MRKKQRKILFLIDDNYCVRCGSRDNLEVDHIVPRVKNKYKINSYENLQILCRSCNASKSTKVINYKEMTSVLRFNLFLCDYNLYKKYTEKYSYYFNAYKKFRNIKAKNINDNYNKLRYRNYKNVNKNLIVKDKKDFIESESIEKLFKEKGL